jgi:hypothetical protein
VSLRLRIVNKSVAAGASTASANHTQTEMYQGHRRTTCWNILCQDWKGLSTSTPCQPETFSEIMKSLPSRLKDLEDLDRAVWAVSEMLRRCLMFAAELCAKGRDCGRKQHGPGIWSSFESLRTKTKIQRREPKDSDSKGFRRTVNQTEIEKDTKD